MMHRRTLRRLSAWLALATLAVALHPAWAALHHVARGTTLPPSLLALCSPQGTLPSLQALLATADAGEPASVEPNTGHSVCPLCRAASWFPVDLLRRDLVFPRPPVRLVWRPAADPPATLVALVLVTAPARAPPPQGG